MATNRLLTLNKEEDFPDHPEGDLKPAVAPATESAPAPESAPEPAFPSGPEPVVEPVPESAVAGVEKEHDTPFFNPPICDTCGKWKFPEHKRGVREIAIDADEKWVQQENHGWVVRKRSKKALLTAACGPRRSKSWPQ